MGDAVPRRSGLLPRLALLLAGRNVCMPAGMSSPGLWVLFQASVRGLAPLAVSLLLLPRPGAFVLLVSVVLFYLVIANDHDGLDAEAAEDDGGSFNSSSGSASVREVAPAGGGSSTWSLGGDEGALGPPGQSRRRARNIEALYRSIQKGRARAELLLVLVSLGVVASLGFRRFTYPSEVAGSFTFWALTAWSLLVLGVLLFFAPLQLQRALDRDAVSARGPLRRRGGAFVTVEVYRGFAVVNGALAALSAAAFLATDQRAGAAQIVVKALAFAQLAVCCASFVAIRFSRSSQRRDTQAQIQARVRILHTFLYGIAASVLLQGAFIGFVYQYGPDLSTEAFWVALAAPLLFFLTLGAATVFLGVTDYGKELQGRVYEALLRTGWVQHRPGWPRPTFEPASLPLSALASPVVYHGLVFLPVTMPLAGTVLREEEWSSTCALALGLEVTAGVLAMCLGLLRVLEISASRRGVRLGLWAELATLALVFGMKAFEAQLVATMECPLEALRGSLQTSVVCFFIVATIGFFGLLPLVDDENLTGAMYMLLGGHAEYFDSAEAICAARGTMRNLLGITVPMALSLPLVGAALTLAAGSAVESLKHTLDEGEDHDGPDVRGGDVLLVGAIMEPLYMGCVLALGLFCRLRRPLYVPLPQILTSWYTPMPVIATGLDVWLGVGISWSLAFAIALFAVDYDHEVAKGCAQAAATFLLIGASWSAIQRVSSTQSNGRLRVETVYQDALVIYSNVDAQQEAMRQEGAQHNENLEGQLVPGENFTWAELLNAQPTHGLGQDAEAWEREKRSVPLIDSRLWVRSLDSLGDVRWVPFETVDAAASALETAPAAAPPMGGGAEGASATVMPCVNYCGPQSHDPRERLYLRRLVPAPDLGFSFALSMRLGLGFGGLGGAGGAGSGAIEWVDGRRFLPEEDSQALLDERWSSAVGTGTGTGAGTGAGTGTGTGMGSAAALLGQGGRFPRFALGLSGACCVLVTTGARAETSISHNHVNKIFFC
mmetsp:Transcript_43993/g.138268  ORF Transcript_43993/g.138268 Transcript_43993/m.138268 type:complete len:1003 (-) Transcript_43993:6-3014(-)